MTVEQFRSLPEDRGELCHELHQGEMVAMTRPKLKHAILQRQLRRLLEGVSPEGSYVDTEVAFRPLPEYELRVADVAYVSAERWARMDPDDYLAGVPELVIEVLSPGNTASEMYEREMMCLRNGGREFWVVDAQRQHVRVARADGPSVTYARGEAIPLTVLGGTTTTLAVDAVFA